MKRIGYLLLLVWVWSGCDKVKEETDPEQDTPEAVVLAIANRFGAVTDFTLTTLSANALYAADFRSQMQHYQTILQVDGTFQTLEIELPATDAPTNIQAYLNNYLPGSNISYLFKSVDPASSALLGYYALLHSDIDENLLSFDPLGARIFQVKIAPNTNWWRYSVQSLTEVPENIRFALQASYPSLQFHHATMLANINASDIWHIALKNGDSLEVFQLNEAAQILDHHIEDLLEIDTTNTNPFDLGNVSQLPTVISDFLDEHFPGWTYQRGFLLLQNNSPIGFLIVVQVNQTVYYTHYDISGSFIGATKG